MKIFLIDMGNTDKVTVRKRNLLKGLYKKKIGKLEKGCKNMTTLD